MEDDANLAVLRRGPVRPIHAGDEDRTAIDDEPFVVQPLDSAMGFEKTRLKGESLVTSPPVQPVHDCIVSARVVAYRGPAAVEEDSHGDPSSCGGEGRVEERIRMIPPRLVEVEHLDPQMVLRGGDEAEESLRIQGRVRRDYQLRTSSGARKGLGQTDGAR